MESFMIVIFNYIKPSHKFKSKNKPLLFTILIYLTLVYSISSRNKINLIIKQDSKKLDISKLIKGIHISLGPHFQDKTNKNIFTVGASLEFKQSDQEKLKKGLIDDYEKELTGLASDRKIEQIKINKDIFIKLMSIPFTTESEEKRIKDFIDIKKKEEFLSVHLGDEKDHSLSDMKMNNDKILNIPNKKTGDFIRYMDNVLSILNRDDNNEYTFLKSLNEIDEIKEKEIKKTELFSVIIIFIFF